MEEVNRSEIGEDRNDPVDTGSFHNPLDAAGIESGSGGRRRDMGKVLTAGIVGQGDLACSFVVDVSNRAGNLVSWADQKVSDLLLVDVRKCFVVAIWYVPLPPGIVRNLALAVDALVDASL